MSGVSEAVVSVASDIWSPNFAENQDSNSDRIENRPNLAVDYALRRTRRLVVPFDDEVGPDPGRNVLIPIVRKPARRIQPENFS
jgi:hypothetical protein